jgi:hypothetical protein
MDKNGVVMTYGMFILAVAAGMFLSNLMWSVFAGLVSYWYQQKYVIPQRKKMQAEYAALVDALVPQDQFNPKMSKLSVN